MEFRLLGPLEVRADGRAVAVTGAKPRALLAMLLLHAGGPVSAERLAQGLWGVDAPPGAVKRVQVHVSRLRKALGDPGVLETTPAGYRVAVREGEIDAARFERRVAAGRQALAAGRPREAATLLDEALALWRGTPLGEFAWAPFAPAEADHLEELRLGALEARVEAELACGHHAELVAELQRLTALHPWRERLHAQLMLALYRSGRQADALAAYRLARAVLVEQLGIEPGAELHALHQAILVHDPALEPPGAAATPAAGQRRPVPGPPNRTIGRDADIETLRDRLRSSSTRLLTLTGPGGVGKTRLALEAARAVEAEFRDGACFVSLAATRRASDVPAAIVASLGIVLLPGEANGRAVERFLAAKQLLLVVDNCEHVLAAAPFIGALPAACPGVTVLATSREPLRVGAEQRHPVEPLPSPGRDAPGNPAALAGVAAVALFCERAQAHDPGFELDGGNAAAVAAICRRVDGLPLAVELAAARCGLLSPAEIAERLHAALDVYGAGARDAPARQQTLRATIDWSHDLLTKEERTCFARFAVLAGGATVEAAAAVTGADLDVLDRLVAKSLIVRRGQPNLRTRLGMLHTVHAYAAERLAVSADAEATGTRHFRHFLALAERHGTERALWGADRHEHLACLDAERENLDAAVEWAAGRKRTDAALSLCGALGWYWLARDRNADAVSWIDRALNGRSTDADPVLCARVLCMKSWALWPLGRDAETPGVMAEAEAVARRTSDASLLARVLENCAVQASWVGRLDVAERLADEALAHATAAGDRWAIAMAARARAMAAGDTQELRERVERAVALLDEVGNAYHVADLLAAAAYAALRTGSDQTARELADRALPHADRIGSPFLVMFLRAKLGLAALFTGDLTAAEAALRDALARCRDLVIPPLAFEGLDGLAAVAAARNELDRSARLAGAAAAHRADAEPQRLVDARLRAAFLESARVRRGPDAWDAAVRDGAELGFEDAIAYALEAPVAARRAG